MTEEVVQGSVPTDDHFKLWFVPEDAEGATTVASVATLTAPTTKAFTYSLTPDGWNHSTTEEVVDDSRLCLKQSLELPGRIADTLEVTYVFGSEDDVANVVLPQGAKGHIVARYAVENGVEPTTGDMVDVFPIEAGVQRKNAPVANGTWTKTQKLFLRGAVQRDVELTA